MCRTQDISDMHTGKERIKVMWNFFLFPPGQIHHHRQKKKKLGVVFVLGMVARLKDLHLKPHEHHIAIHLKELSSTMTQYCSLAIISIPM